MDDVDAEIIAALQRNRKYAGFFEWSADRDLAEHGVVESLAKSLDKRGELFFSDLKIRGRGNDPPDLEAVDAEGRRVAIEVTELVDGKVAHAHQVGRTWEVAEWKRDDFLVALKTRLATKDAKFAKLEDGPYPGGYVVVVFTDETFLMWLAVEDHLKGQAFDGMPNISRAFLLLSYFPGKGYPYFELEVS
ncbi:hypothetical protein D9M68_654260 [compost metagenome]